MCAFEVHGNVLDIQFDGGEDLRLVRGGVWKLRKCDSGNVMTLTDAREALVSTHYSRRAIKKLWQWHGGKYIFVKREVIPQAFSWLN